MAVTFSLSDVLKDVKTVGIAGHINPDGDCVGSTLGLYNFIVENYKDIDARIFLEPIPNKFKFLKNADKIEQANEDITFDVFFVLDCGSGDRLGDSYKYFEAAKKTVCIDHHKSNLSFADINYIIPDASSACELVYDVICENDFSKSVAECIYVGMVTDTGVFQYSSTDGKTMTVAGKLMDMGINFSRIVEDVFFAETFEQSRIKSYAILKSKLYENGSIIATYINRAEMEEYNVQYKELDGIVAALRNVRGVNVSIFLYEKEDGSYKVSTRATEGVDLSLIAVKYNGGGHAKAAGFQMVGEPESLIAEVIEEIKKQL